MKIKIDEAKTLEFKIDTSSGCALEDLEGYLRFSFGGVEYGFPAKITEGCFKVEIPPFKNVVNDQITESISKNKALIVKGRLDVIANKNTYVTPWQGDIDIEVPVSMKISEGKEILEPEKKVIVSDPDKESMIEEFNKLFNDPTDEVDEAVKASKFKDVLVEEEGGTLDEGEEKVARFSKKLKQLEYWTSRNTSTTVNCEDMKKAKAIVKNSGVTQKIVSESIENVKRLLNSPPKKSRFAENLEQAYVKTGV
jgi:hypothetical protein